MAGAFAHNQIIGDSITVVIVGVVVAFLSRNKAADQARGLFPEHRPEVFSET